MADKLLPSGRERAQAYIEWGRIPSCEAMALVPGMGYTYVMVRIPDIVCLEAASCQEMREKAAQALIRMAKAILEEVPLGPVGKERI